MLLDIKFFFFFLIFFGFFNFNLIKDDGDIYSMGDNNEGKLGVGERDTFFSNIPICVKKPNNAIKSNN